MCEHARDRVAPHAHLDLFVALLPDFRACLALACPGDIVELKIQRGGTTAPVRAATLHVGAQSIRLETVKDLARKVGVASVA